MILVPDHKQTEGRPWAKPSPVETELNNGNSKIGEYFKKILNQPDPLILPDVDETEKIHQTK